MVTARKRTESVQDIPLSISVFSEEDIAAAGIRDIDDIARLTPGLVFDKGWIPQDTRPHIRGLPTDRGRAPVGILVDGIDISSESMLTSGGGMLMNLKVMDIERIEVVKGPQSALYGRVAFGGAVNYVSRAPSDEFEADFSADVGQYGQTEARVGVSFPVSETFGLRINAVTAQHDGYYENEVSGEGIGGSDSTGVSVAAALQPSDTFNLDLRVAYSSDEYEIRPQMQLASKTGHADPVYLPAHVVGVLAPGPFGPTPYPANVFAPPDGPIPLLDRIAASLNPYTGEDYEGSTFDSLLVHARAEWDFGGAKLNAWLGATSAETTQNMDVDYYGEPWQPVFLPSPGVNEPLPAQFLFDLDTDIDQTNLELRLGDLESDGFRWAVGGLYWNEEVRQKNGNLIVLMFVPFISAGQNVAAQGPITKRDEGRDTDHWSVYGILEYDFNDRPDRFGGSPLLGRVHGYVLDRGRKRHDRRGVCGTHSREHEPDRVAGFRGQLLHPAVHAGIPVLREHSHLRFHSKGRQAGRRVHYCEPEPPYRALRAGGTVELRSRIQEHAGGRARDVQRRGVLHGLRGQADREP